ncbi:hypothetical protein H5398_15435 [Tessaracoccus sp. MC1679]|uniref:DNA methyltransferase n=1 Tax=Tessaracoccus sp. MC1679 TaxID=2760313 RepID=UPI0015FF6AE7|nr:hypothetical protein [Tessaracoccus sp. MC1679]
MHFSTSLVGAVLEDLTRPGDRVLDPFAGFGTTPRMAESMGRRQSASSCCPTGAPRRQRWPPCPRWCRATPGNCRASSSAPSTWC